MQNPAMPTSDPTLTGDPTFGPPALVVLTAFARRIAPDHPAIAAAIMRDVEHDLTLSLDLLGSIVDDQAAGILPATEAMTAVRALARTLGIFR